MLAGARYVNGAIDDAPSNGITWPYDLLTNAMYTVYTIRQRKMKRQRVRTRAQIFNVHTGACRLAVRVRQVGQEGLKNKGIVGRRKSWAKGLISFGDSQQQHMSKSEREHVRSSVQTGTYPQNDQDE